MPLVPASRVVQEACVAVCHLDPRSRRASGRMLRRRVARAGIEKRVHAHGFEHSHAASPMYRHFGLAHS